MRGLQQHSLVVRATLWIVVLVAAVGLVSLWLGNALSVQRETIHTQTKLRELLDTVERSASIACFLGDKQLANEVAHGLLANRIVKEVTILGGENPLAEVERSAQTVPAQTQARPRPGEPPEDAILRPVFSPFDPKERVGEIRLLPDQAEIAKRVTEASWFIGVLMFVQILAVGVAVVAVVYGFVTRPLTRLAGQLRILPAEQGEKLVQRVGHDRDEIGELVSYSHRINHPDVYWNKKHVEVSILVYDH